MTISVSDGVYSVKCDKPGCKNRATLKGKVSASNTGTPVRKLGWQVKTFRHPYAPDKHFCPTHIKAVVAKKTAPKKPAVKRPAKVEFKEPTSMPSFSFGGGTTETSNSED